jgi:short-subunit dehydrogenase
VSRPDQGAPIAGQRVWVVGASSGIGAALARELYRRGAAVAVTARRADRLEQIAGQELVPVTADVTDPEAISAAADVVRQSLDGLDVVIWCAGHWQRFDSLAWDSEAFAQHVEVNLLGLNNVIGAVLPDMVKRSQGHLVVVASVAGYRGLPGAEAYGATKAAQINLLESLRASLSRHRIRVTTVCPGFVRTEMTAGNTFAMPFLIDADTAARAIADGLEGRRTEIVFPWQMAVLMKLARVLPVRLWTAISARAANE